MADEHEARLADAAEAAAALRLTAKDLVALKVADGIVPEPPGGAGRDPATAIALVRKAVVENLRSLAGEPGGIRLVEKRYRKFQAMGKFDPRKAVRV